MNIKDIKSLKNGKFNIIIEINGDIDTIDFGKSKNEKVKKNNKTIEISILSKNEYDGIINLKQKYNINCRNDINHFIESLENMKKLILRQNSL